MNMNSYPFLIIAAISLSLASACSTAPRSAVGSPGASAEAAPPGFKVDPTQSSSVDITYVLGHYQHRFTAQSDEKNATAETFLEKDKVEEGPIDRSQYVEFLQKAAAFVAHSKTPLGRDVANAGACRNPFTITVWIGKETYTSNGCRSNDDGALSHLVKEGEFLLYSKK
jgi:hypothetical protein